MGMTGVKDERVMYIGWLCLWLRCREIEKGNWGGGEMRKGRNNGRVGTRYGGDFQVIGVKSESNIYRLDLFVVTL